MPKQYRTRNGTITAANTKTALTEQGSISAPGTLYVPDGVSRLESVIVAACADYAAAGHACIFVRLEGSGLPEGPETLLVCGVGGNSTTGIQGRMAAVKIPLDVPVRPGNDILIYGEMAGDDVGTVELGVTLVFA